MASQPYSEAIQVNIQPMVGGETKPHWLLRRANLVVQELSNENSRNGAWWMVHWIGLRENLQETMVFTIKYRVSL